MELVAKAPHHLVERVALKPAGALVLAVVVVAYLQRSLGLLSAGLDL